jgi:hypothetical protein
MLIGVVLVLIQELLQVWQQIGQFMHSLALRFGNGLDILDLTEPAEIIYRNTNGYKSQLLYCCMHVCVCVCVCVWIGYSVYSAAATATTATAVPLIGDSDIPAIKCRFLQPEHRTMTIPF